MKSVVRLSDVLLNSHDVWERRNPMPNVHTLDVISPLDGRYYSKVAELASYASEAALFRYRLRIEVEYFIALMKHLNINILGSAGVLRHMYETFNDRDAAQIKDWDNRVNHDVKAVEYWLRDQFEFAQLGHLKEWIHFGLTSEDVNNLAYTLMAQDAVSVCLHPAVENILERMRTLVIVEARTPMLARTHGQPATPTTFGKEISVFVSRLQEAMNEVLGMQLTGKLNGASGTFSAHKVAFPDGNWPAFSRSFVSSIGLTPNPRTTQIEPHDRLCKLFDGIRRMNMILLDLCQDIWLYISQDYITQIPASGDVGSSTMPHKVNPINFENAEANILLGNALLEVFSRKLPVSRLQRDLSDSSVMRNIGVAFAYSLQAYKEILKGLGKIQPNRQRMADDLMAHPEVLTEAIQTVLRAEGIPNGYEIMKTLSRGQQTTLDGLRAFITTLDIRQDAKDRLLALTPMEYIGYAVQLALDE